MSATMWLPLLPALTATHHVRMLDAPGDTNKSVSTAVMSSPAKVVQWIDEALDALDIERTAIASASVGTWMATHYAMARPERVERIAMLCPAGIVCRLDPKWLVTVLMRVALRPTVAKAEWLFDSMAMEPTRPELRVDPWRPIAQQFIVGLASFKPNFREPRPATCKIDALAASGIRVLAVIGRDETLHDGATMADRFRQRLPNAQVELVDDANHLVFIDQPERVSEYLRKFLGAS